MDGRRWKTCQSETDGERMMCSKKMKNECRGMRKQESRERREREKSQEGKRKEGGSFRGR